MKKIFYLLILVFLITIVKGVDLSCSIVAKGDCSDTIVLYMENDTGGYTNAHAENTSYSSYAYAVCCNADAISATVETTCNGTVFLKLSNETNAHVEENTQTNYKYEACINTDATNVTCRYATSCYTNETCLLSYASSGSSNQTNAHISDCDHYDNLLCCGTGNNAPSVPDLFLPANDTYMTNRTPTFSWSNSTDPEEDTITYNIQVDGSIDFSSPAVDGFDAGSITEIANTTNWTATSDLEELDTEYFWRVRAYDGIAYSGWSEIRNFSIISVIVIELPTEDINFTVSNPGDSDDTSDDSPAPIVIRNEGNVGSDVNISLASGSTGLWASKHSPTNYFQYKIDNKTGEEYSFNESDSILDWTNVDVGDLSYKIRNLNYSDLTDEAELDIKIEVPLDEPAGLKTASLIITGAITSEAP